MPEARILIGHGQMEKDDLEVVMHTFVKGEADVLLATTIIETGIDIPNANTILIDRADRFGLADLYQLRGRVGRAGEKAYAILLLPRDMMTVGDARKRIHAIKQYTALGSGFKIAMRDLEIRGAGNLLGTKQSGHIAQIGFDLYCQLLRQSVDRLKGRKDAPRGECHLQGRLRHHHRDRIPQSKIHNSTFSNPRLSPPSSRPPGSTETQLRITAYRELSEAGTEKAVDALEASWRDRFGRLPDAAANLLQIARIKALAAAENIASVEIRASASCSTAAATTSCSKAAVSPASRPTARKASSPKPSRCCGCCDLSWQNKTAATENPNPLSPSRGVCLVWEHPARP